MSSENPSTAIEPGLSDDETETDGGFEAILIALARADTSKGPVSIRCSDGVVFTVSAVPDSDAADETDDPWW